MSITPIILFEDNFICRNNFLNLKTFPINGLGNALFFSCTEIHSNHFLRWNAIKLDVTNTYTIVLKVRCSIYVLSISLRDEIKTSKVLFYDSKGDELQTLNSFLLLF